MPTRPYYSPARFGGFPCTLQPAGDGVAAEADHAAPIAVQLGDQGVVHQVQVADELFSAALRAELAHQRFGQRGETGNIGEQNGARRPVRQAHRRPGAGPLEYMLSGIP
jgi:hypothetical protein